MNRSDFYGVSSFWRNNGVLGLSRYSSIKNLMAIPLVATILFYPANISGGVLEFTSADNQSYRLSIPSYEKSKFLEEKLDKMFDEYFLKGNLTKRIDSKINELLGSEDSKKGLELTLSKLSAYEDYMIEASKETELDINFIKAYIAQESNGNYDSKSNKGSTGFGGLRELAAKETGLRVDEYVDERFDPRSIVASARYMKKCIERFGHIIGLVAYNSGPYRTSKNLKQILKKPDILRNEVIPGESRDYITQVLARTKIFSSPEEYKLDFIKKEYISMGFKQHYTKEDTSLRKLAKKYGISISDLRKANPSLKTDIIPKDVVVHIPKSY